VTAALRNAVVVFEQGNERALRLVACRSDETNADSWLLLHRDCQNVEVEQASVVSCQCQ
jgi:hypothetical protein